MEQRRKWSGLGWEGPLLLVGALAAGLFVAAGSCDGNDNNNKSGAVGEIPAEPAPSRASVAPAVRARSTRWSPRRPSRL